MSVCHLRYIAAPLRRTVWALIFFVFLFSVPSPLFADTPPLLLEVSSALSSFYGSKFEGKKTANGQRYNSEALTAAHRSLPFGTVVRVTNLANGRDAIVRINDRGPMSKRLLLDLSRAAARELNMIRAGVTKIHMEQVGDSRGRPVIPGTEFYLDLGTASSESRGKAEVERVRGQVSLPPGKNLRLVREAMPGKKVRLFVGVGPFSSFTKAEKAFMRLKKVLPRTRVVCAKTRELPVGATLALAVPADNLPESVANYKGKSYEAKASKSSKSAKAKKSSRSSKRSVYSASKKTIQKKTASSKLAAKSTASTQKVAVKKVPAKRNAATASTTRVASKKSAYRSIAKK